MYDRALSSSEINYLIDLKAEGGCPTTGGTSRRRYGKVLDSGRALKKNLTLSSAMDGKKMRPVKIYSMWHN